MFIYSKYLLNYRTKCMRTIELKYPTVYSTDILKLCIQNNHHQTDILINLFINMYLKLYVFTEGLFLE